MGVLQQVAGTPGKWGRIGRRLRRWPWAEGQASGSLPLSSLKSGTWEQTAWDVCALTIASFRLQPEPILLGQETVGSLLAGGQESFEVPSEQVGDSKGQEEAVPVQLCVPAQAPLHSHATTSSLGDFGQVT